MAHITDIFLSGLAGALLVGIVVPITIKIWNMMLRYRDKQKIRKYFTDTIKNEVSRKLKANNLKVSHEDFYLIEYQAASTLNIQQEYIRELLYEIKDFEIYDKASMPEKNKSYKR